MYTYVYIYIYTLTFIYLFLHIRKFRTVHHECGRSLLSCIRVPLPLPQQQGRCKRARQVGKDGLDDEAQTSLAAAMQVLNVLDHGFIGT